MFLHKNMLLPPKIGSLFYFSGESCKAGFFFLDFKNIIIIEDGQAVFAQKPDLSEDGNSLDIL